MSKKVLFILLPFLITLISLSFPKQETTYLNLDFEDVGWKESPKFWYCFGWGYKMALNSENVHSGKYSLFITAEKATRYGSGEATSTFPIEDARGKKVRFKGYIKTENVTDGYAGLWWRVDGKNKKGIILENMKDRGAVGTTPWKEYVIELDVPAEGDNIDFGVLLTGAGKAWFDKLEITLNNVPYQQVKPKPVIPVKADLEWIQANAVPFKTAEPFAPHQELLPLKEMIGKRRIAALGEATHGTSEFFKMKHRLVRFLAEEMGFTVFAIEANMPEARKVNRYILKGEGDPKKALAGLYFWTWNTSEVLDMIKWMREYNKSGKGHIEFYGFDMQTPDVAMKSVAEFVKKADPDSFQSLAGLMSEMEEALKSIRKTYGENKSDFDKWYRAAKKVYDHLQSKREIYIKSIDALEVDWALQDANVILQGAEFWSEGKRSRDQSMAENINWILAHNPPGTRVILWAHNDHVSKGISSFQSMGYYLNKDHGDDMIVFAFAFHEGEYTARGKEGINRYGTSPSEPGTVEWFLKSSGIPNFILDLRKADKGEPGSRWLNRKLDFRSSLGAAAMDYAFAKRDISREFDALIYIEKSTPSDCFNSKAGKREKQ